MEEEAQEIVEESDLIQVQEPVESNDDPLDMGLGLPNTDMDMGLGLDF